MVYRLHRATKSLFVKVLIVILLYSMIIGFFGWIFIGFAATFDTQSFHYNLVDSNPVEDANERILCEQIEQECDWNTLQTLKDDISFQELDNTPVKSLLEAFQLKFDRGNYYAVNESSTSTLTLAEANIRFNFDGIWIDSTTSIPISDLGMVNSGTNIPDELIDEFNKGVDQGLDFCAFSGAFPSACNNNFYVYDKLVGLGAFFGIGTAGSTAARSQLQGVVIVGTDAFQSGFAKLLSFDTSFILSAVVWTVGIFFVVTAIYLPGTILVSLHYLSTWHLNSVKNVRQTLKEKEIFLGTIQQSIDHVGDDKTIYYDSEKGEDQFFSE